mmetsp:Transcript_3213/g.7560  ORF Transcript_3213/g.7560 Transcript_3213/m.7560 type:complete len:226 (-) Transcript_3213:2402-3079(-)
MTPMNAKEYSNMLLLTIASFRGCRGFLCMSEASAGCAAYAMAVQMSVPMSMRITCTVVSATGMPSNCAKVGNAWGILEHIVYSTDFRKFSAQRRPCSMPAATLCRSSSNRTMSAASLATSVPRMPIAIPTSASFNAGASFTPSPVMATIWPENCWYACTMACLLSGETLAKTRVCLTHICQNLAHRTHSGSCIDPADSEAFAATSAKVMPSGGSPCCAIMAPVTA